LAISAAIDSVKRIKQTRQTLRRHAWPLIRNGQDNSVPLSRRRDFDVAVWSMKARIPENITHGAPEQIWHRFH
jgi:hypothetical protein